VGALYLRLGAFEAELMDYIHLENNVLFRRVLAA
jgi:iron-sulfur cluster repair protein YtfE (RIC family)